MARITGKDGKVKLGGVEVARITNWSIDTKIDIVDATAMQDAWHQKLSTFKSWTGSVEGVWENDGSNKQFWDTFLTAATATLELYPVGTATEKWSGSAFCDFSIKVAKDAVVMFTARVEGTDALTRTP